MINARLQIYTQGEELPTLSESNFFHSPTLFRMMEQTPGVTPYMVVAEDEQGKPLAHLLATVRRRGSLLPPYIFSQGRVYGEGWYAEDEHRDELFALMLEAITRQLHKRLCLYIEFSDISKKMFGYKTFRQNNYFPISWMQIQNSLHSRQPELRLEEKMLQQIDHGYRMGIETREAAKEAEVLALYKVLKGYYRFRFQRYVPHQEMFLLMMKNPSCKLNITLYKGKVIGGSVVVNSGGNAYLWYEASRKKRHPLLRPHLNTIWHAIKSSYDDHQRHICFLNVGLPFSRNRYREFILAYGGKPLTTYRWFHFTFQWLNRLLSWVYRE